MIHTYLSSFRIPALKLLPLYHLAEKVRQGPKSAYFDVYCRSFVRGLKSFCNSADSKITFTQEENKG